MSPWGVFLFKPPQLFSETLKNKWPFLEIARKATLLVIYSLVKAVIGETGMLCGFSDFVRRPLEVGRYYRQRTSGYDDLLGRWESSMRQELAIALRFCVYIFHIVALQ